MTHSERSWLSVHVELRPPFEPFLTRVAFPFVRAQLAEGTLSGWFFVRQPEPAPHVRLRLRLGEGLDAREAAALIEAELFDTSLGHRATWTPYEPEYERYGGRSMMAAAEMQFQASSAAVLEMLASSTRWEYRHAFAGALRLHFALTLTCLADKEARGAFWWNVERDWEPFGHEILTRRGRPTGELRTHFEQRWRAHGALLRRELMVIAKALVAAGGPDWLNGFRVSMQQVEARYRDAGVSFREARRPGPVHEILQSFAHMTNNRLGLANGDEACAAHLVRRALEEEGLD